MTKPEPAFPESHIFFTRRVQGRLCLLRPDPQTFNAWLYPNSLALERSGLLFLAGCVMSNHDHLVAFDPLGSRTQFLELRNGMISRSLNQHRGRSGYFFQATTARDKQTLHECSAVLNAIVYTLVNPVKAGLVDWPHEWPGIVGDWRHLLSTSYTATKPTFFYDQRSPEEGGLPDSLTIKPSMPPCFANMEMSPSDYETLVRETVEARCREIHRARIRPALGATRALQVDPFSIPAPSEEEDEPRRFRGSERVVEALAALWLSFLGAYTRARNLRLRGREAVFPHGTDRYRHKESARVAKRDPDSVYFFAPDGFT